jgi:hypothetical protein
MNRLGEDVFKRMFRIDRATFDFVLSETESYFTINDTKAGNSSGEPITLMMRLAVLHLVKDVPEDVYDRMTSEQVADVCMCWDERLVPVRVILRVLNIIVNDGEKPDCFNDATKVMAISQFKSMRLRQQWKE